MIVSRREIARFLIFVVVAGAAVLYVSSNRDSLMKIILGQTPEAPAASRQGEAPDVIPETEAAIAVVDFSSDEDLSLVEALGASSGDPFIEFRLEREQARSQQLDLLREVMSNDNLSQESRDRALSVWLEITAAVGHEVELENLIRAKGYADVVVVLGDGRAVILVKADTLTREEVVRIADLVVRVAGLRYEDVTVVPKGG